MNHLFIKTNYVSLWNMLMEVFFFIHFHKFQLRRFKFGNKKKHRRKKIYRGGSNMDMAITSMSSDKLYPLKENFA